MLMEFYIITKSEDSREFIMEDSRGYRWTKNVFQVLTFKNFDSAEKWLKNIVEGWSNNLGLTVENTKIRKLNFTIG